jgi:two-component system LytT family response regulator
MTAVIADDEELARRYLRELLAAHPEIEVAAECANGFETVKAVTELKPDLLFLDIQMPKLDGFEVLELIEGETAVIFVTAYDTYALRAFEVHAVDYLLKPFSAGRFEQALQRARLRAGPAAPPATQLSEAARAGSRYLERFIVKDGVNVHVIPVENLDYIEAQDDYIALKTEGKSVLKQQTISAVEAALDPSRFVRIHRSFIVNVERVVKIEPYSKDSKVAILRSGARLPVSRVGYRRLSELLDSA